MATVDLPKSFKTPSGAEIPAIGLGTWQSKPDDVAEAVKLALQAGYRHIDNAPGYGNEAGVGQGIRASGVPREQIWVTSKLWCDKHHPSRVKPALEVTLENLGLSYVDLYLIHWPLAFVPSDDRFGIRDKDNRVILEAGVTIEDTWKAMEGLVDDGLAKNIGVSNFNIENLKRVLKVAKKPITTNQIEVHPYLPQEELISFCKNQNILVTAYAPIGGPADWRSIRATIPRVEPADTSQLKDMTVALGGPSDRSLVKDKTVLEIAEKNMLDAGQVLLSWAIQRGTVPVPKSTRAERIKSNLNVKRLPTEDLQKLDELHKTAGVHRVYDGAEFWGHPVF